MSTARSLARRVRQQLRRGGIVNRGGRGVVGLIDVGSVGELSEPWYRHAASVSHVLKFEPRDPSRRLRNVETIDAALWKEPARLPFYVYKGLQGTGSSLFRQNLDYVRQNFETLRKRGPIELAETWLERSEIDHVVELDCTTLDEVLSNQPKPYHVLKVDAQGAEQQILEGAIDYLAGGDCQALHLELFRIPLYENATLRPDVQAWLEERGFDLVKENHPHGTFDSQNDCVFLRRDAKGPIAGTIRSVYGLS